MHGATVAIVCITWNQLPRLICTPLSSYHSLQTSMTRNLNPGNCLSTLAVLFFCHLMPSTRMYRLSSSISALLLGKLFKLLNLARYVLLCVPTNFQELYYKSVSSCHIEVSWHEQRIQSCEDRETVLNGPLVQVKHVKIIKYVKQIQEEESIEENNKLAQNTKLLSS